MATIQGNSEPAVTGSVPLSEGVSEHVAARRLGLSVDTLRRDRRLGQLGIPFMKFGAGKRGCVRYDTADLEEFAAARKRVGRAQFQRLEPVEETRAAPLPVMPEPETEPEPDEPEVELPAVLRMPTRPLSPWETMARTGVEEPEADPFARNDRPVRRQRPGYWGR